MPSSSRGLASESRAWRAWLAKCEPWLFDDAPGFVVLGLAAAIGAALAVRIFGIGYLLGTSAWWSYPSGDAATMLMGFRYFSHDGWHWPLTQTYATHAPAGINIIYLDAIPLAALIGKLLAPIFGSTFHPYGVWHLAIYVLQSVFGALLARKVGIRGLLGGVACGALCVTMSVFLLRFYHEGLNGQFVLLWALLNYVRSTPQTRVWSLSLGWAACLICALLIHPYLAAMALAIACSAHLRLALLDRRHAAISGASSLLGLVLAWLSAGYVFQKPSYGEAIQFGMTSTNLMSLFVPFYSKLFGAWLPPTAIQETTGYQWDGQNFLGFGVLALLLVTIVAARRPALELLRRHKWLVIGLLLMAAYAPSNKWTFGQHVLFDLPIGDRLRFALATFRATGRFLWPAGYALAIAVTVLVVRRFGRRGIVGVTVAAALQLVDSSASWAIITPAFATPWERYVDWARWDRALEGHKRLVMVPSNNCWPPGGPDRPHRVELEIEFMAAARGMHTNDGRTARLFADCEGQRAEIAEAARTGFAKGTLYVLVKPGYDAAQAAELGGDHCVDFGDGWACSAGPRAHLEGAFGP